MFDWFRKKASSELAKGAVIVINPEYKEKPRKEKMTHYQMVKTFQKHLLWVLDKTTDEIMDVPKENHMMHATNPGKDVCTFMRGKTSISICGKPHSDPVHNLNGRFELEGKDWEILAELDEMIDEVQKKICIKYGHDVIDDQCGRPEHRYCVDCHQSTPNHKCNYDDV